VDDEATKRASSRTATSAALAAMLGIEREQAMGARASCY
jgi:hypothetical protein